MADAARPRHAHRLAHVPGQVSGRHQAFRQLAGMEGRGDVGVPPRQEGEQLHVNPVQLQGRGMRLGRHQVESDQLWQALHGLRAGGQGGKDAGGGGVCGWGSGRRAGGAQA